MRWISTSLVLLSVLAPAHAQSGAEVVRSKGCLNCHDVDKKKMGPSFKDIAASRRSSAEMLTRLKDGKTHPKIAATDAELKAALDYVMAAR
jgi:cytochrome c551/c552